MTQGLIIEIFLTNQLILYKKYKNIRKTEAGQAVVFTA